MAQPRNRAPARRRRQRRPVGVAPFRVRPSVLAAAMVAAIVVGAALLRLATPPSRDRAPPLTREQARAVNAAIPFVAGSLVPARPFVFHGSPAARLQAAECLATAALYEAGDDPRAQRAVMQVVLNRVGRPGFAPTVCGVVYQGAGLKTGCQFSFTCDGSARRRPERRGWAAARLLAGHALGGAVFRPVGTATHYHTDWVVPYWSASLDKIAQIRSHIFYRRKAAGKVS